MPRFRRDFLRPINLTLYPVRIEISTLCPFVSARPCWVAEMASNKLWRSVSDQPFCDNQKPYRSRIRIKNEIAKPPYLILHHAFIMKTFSLASDAVSQKRQEKDSRT